MAAPTIIRSSDSAAVSASAILTGNAGSLIAVLDYALVTVLGWGKAFSGTNAASYRAPSGVRHYLDVNDNGPDATALGRNARLRGYETMSAVATGTGPFPTTAQVATAVYVKSTATGTTARPWIIIGDDKTFYMFSSAGGTDPPTLSTNFWTDGFWFGEILSAVTGDSYRTILFFPSTTSTAVAAATGARASDPSTTTFPCAAMPRSYLGTGGAEHVGPAATTFTLNTSTLYSSASTSLLFPNAPDGGVYLNGIDVFSRGSGTAPVIATYIRGRLRGFYSTAHYLTAMNDQDTFSGVGDFAGKTFMALHQSVKGQGVVFETTAWAASS